MPAKEKKKILKNAPGKTEIPPEPVNFGDFFDSIPLWVNPKLTSKVKIEQIIEKFKGFGYVPPTSSTPPRLTDASEEGKARDKAESPTVTGGPQEADKETEEITAGKGGEKTSQGEPLINLKDHATSNKEINVVLYADDHLGIFVIGKSKRLASFGKEVLFGKKTTLQKYFYDFIKNKGEIILENKKIESSIKKRKGNLNKLLYEKLGLPEQDPIKLKGTITLPNGEVKKETIVGGNLLKMKKIKYTGKAYILDLGIFDKSSIKPEDDNESYCNYNFPKDGRESEFAEQLPYKERVKTSNIDYNGNKNFR